MKSTSDNKCVKFEVFNTFTSSMIYKTEEREKRKFMSLDLTDRDFEFINRECRLFKENMRKGERIAMDIYLKEVINNGNKESRSNKDRAKRREERKSKRI